MRIPRPSRKRLLVSAALSVIGFAAAAIAFQQLTTFSAFMDDEIALAIWFLGITLFGAGVLCPFRRATAGALSGFIVAAVLIINPVRTSEGDASETFRKVAEELGAVHPEAVDRSGATALPLDF